MQGKAKITATKIAAGYVLVAGLWTLLSDELLAVFIPDTSRRLLFSVIKSWAFVLLMGLLLYQLLRLSLARWEREVQHRREAEQVLRRTERALKTISFCNKVLVRAMDETTLLREVCRVIVEQGGYRMAWVGRAVQDEAKSVQVAAVAGFDGGYLEKLQLTWADTERGQGPTGIALRTRQIAACDNFQTDPKATCWRELAKRHGFGSSISLPISHGKLLSALTIYAAEPNAFNQSEIELLQGLSDDLAYGIQALRARSEQELAKEALRASEARLQYLLMASPAVIYSFQAGHQRRTTFVSANVTALLGHSPENFLNDPHFWQSHIHPEDARQLFSAEAAWPTHGTIRREYRFRHANGSYRWMHDEMQTVCDQSGQVMEYVGYWFDITERRYTESALAHSEARFLQMAGCLKDVLYGVDGRSREFIYVSPAFERMLGYTLADVQTLGGREKFLQAVIQGDPFAEQHQGFKSLQAEATEQSPLWQSWWRCKDGSLKFIEDLSIPVYAEGRLQSTYGVLRDITERKRIETVISEQMALQEQLTKIAASVPGVIYAFQLRADGSSFFPYASPAIEQLFGITAEALAEDASVIFAGIHPEDLARVRAGVEYSARTLTQWHDEYRFRHHERGVIWIMGRSVPKRQEDGSIIWHGFTMEVTESRQQQEALAKSISLLNATLESTADGILVVNQSGRVSSYNQKFLKMWRVPRELAATSDDGKLLQSVREQLVDPDDFFNKVQELYEQPQANSWDELYFRDGRVFERYSQPHRLGDTIVGRVWSFRDITQNKLAEELVRREQEFTRAVLDNIPAFIFWKDRDLRYMGCNRLFAEAANLASPTAIIGLDDFAMPWVADAEMYRRDDQQILATRQPRLNYEEPQHRPDGSVRWLKTSKTLLLHKSGEIEGILGIYIDITESKRSEATMARLATAVEQAAETIVISDLDGTIVYVNPAFERSTGYTRAEAIGRNSNLLRSGKQDADFYQRLWTVLQRGEIWSGHFVNRRKDGSLYEEEATISPVRDSQGLVVNFVAVKRDVTREVQLENQFRQAQKMEAIGTLAGGIAHDFNNILAAMFGYGYLLQQDTEGNQAAQENIAEILQAATRAKDLVTQILTFSRQREQRRAVIHLETVLKEALKFLRASLPANIKIEASYDPHTPTVMADPTQIYQVAINLATNSLHAMEGRPGLLTVRLNLFQPDTEFLQTHPTFRPIHYARLAITDTGHGMDAATVERIFDPFFTTKPVGKGTGLGLAVVHGIVQSHEGAITVDSALERGTTFCVYLPEQMDATTLTQPAASCLHTGAGQHILLVDDEPALTKIFDRLLTRLNYRVTINTSAHAALELFRTNPHAYQLAITDLTMPEMNGLDLAQEFARLRPGFPVILSSGFTSSLNRDQLREAGICELLEKPVTLAALADTVERALAGSPAEPTAT